jgi:predicted PurR-regulated permease PerM
MTSTRAIAWLVFAAIAGALLYLLAPVLTPFLLAAVLSYMANPLVGCLVGLRLPRSLAVIAVFALALALIAISMVVLLPMTYRQLAGFAAKLPQYLDWVQQNLLPRLEALVDQPLPVDFGDLRGAVVAHWQEIARFARDALANAVSSSFRFGVWLVNLVLVPVVAFYLLLDWDTVVKNTLSLFPPRARATVVRLATETDEVLGSFLRGQLLVMLSLAVFDSVGLLLIGLDLALPIGVLAGLLSFVPFLGFIVGFGAAAIAAYLQFQDPIVLAWVAVLFVIANVLEGYVLSPRLVGARIGLHPIAVIFAVLAGGALFGFLGVLLALPAAAVLKVWLRHWHRHYVDSDGDPADKPKRSRRAAPSATG